MRITPELSLPFSVTIGFHKCVLFQFALSNDIRRGDSRQCTLLRYPTDSPLRLCWQHPL